MSVYGIFNADGSVKQAATHSILTGRHLAQVDTVLEIVPGTPFFYRVETELYGHVTTAARALLYEQVKLLHRSVEIATALVALPREVKPRIRAANTKPLTDEELTQVEEFITQLRRGKQP